MHDIAATNAHAMGYINEILLEHWTLTHDGGYRFGYMTTNLSDTYNAVLKGARRVPITVLVRKMFYNCIQYFEQRWAEANAAIGRQELFTQFSFDLLSKWKVKGNHQHITAFDSRYHKYGSGGSIYV